jgi:hypothetical protein
MQREEREEREKSDFLLYRNAAGEVADFHATRHTYISGIVAGGASVKAAQELARHSTSRLTVDRYAHARLHDLRGALEALPDYDHRQTADNQTGQLRATGTDGATNPSGAGAQRVAQRRERETVPFDATPSDKSDAESTENKTPGESQVEAPSEVVRVDAISDEKRRRWESNPRWRICNPLP